MDGLKDEFAGQVDFFDFDVDDPNTEELLLQLGFSGRSQYALTNAEGEVIRRWFGPLNPTISQEVAALLEG